MWGLGGENPSTDTDTPFTGSEAGPVCKGQSRGMNALPCIFLRRVMVIILKTAYYLFLWGARQLRVKCHHMADNRQGTIPIPNFQNPAALRARGHYSSLANCCHRPCVSRAVNTPQTQCSTRQRLWVRHMSRIKRD